LSSLRALAAAVAPAATPPIIKRFFINFSSGNAPNIVYLVASGKYYAKVFIFCIQSLEELYRVVGELLEIRGVGNNTLAG
jgi:hypothetical protein